MVPLSCVLSPIVAMVLRCPCLVLVNHVELVEVEQDGLFSYVTATCQDDMVVGALLIVTRDATNETVPLLLVGQCDLVVSAGNVPEQEKGVFVVLLCPLEPAFFLPRMEPTVHERIIVRVCPVLTAVVSLASSRSITICPHDDLGLSC